MKISKNLPKHKRPWKHAVAGLGAGVVLFFGLVYFGVLPKVTRLPVVNPTPTSITPTASVSATLDQCHTDGIFPDPQCTPGVVNPNVTQANIQSTICVSGFTKTIRPPVSYTNTLKLKQIQQYGYINPNPKLYEEDHFIALEDGGSPTDPGNLWPEPFSPVPGAHQKDLVENLIHSRICSGQITLQEGQRELTNDWTQIK